MVDGGAEGGREPEAATAPPGWDEGVRRLLRPVLQATVDVVREGLAADPPVEAPEGLGPVLRFRSLSGPALAVVRRALEDPGLRSRVRAASEPDAAGALLLDRPRGWAEALLRLAGAGPGAGAPDGPAERALHRRLRGAEEARSRAEQALAEVEATAAERRSEVDDLRARIRSLEVAASEASGRASRLEAALAERDAALDAVGDELVAAHELARRLRGELAEVRDRAGPDPDEVRRLLVEARRSLGEVSGAVGAVARVVDAAGGAFDGLADGLDPLLRPAPPAVRAERTPVAPPPGLTVDHPDAVAALLATPGLLVLVDGYNVTITAWGDRLALDEQRAVLERRLSAVAARLGLDVLVVFDGAAVGDRAARGRALVSVRFTEPGIEADDEILRVVAEAPPARPVAVVSDDRRVRRGAAELGANLLTVAQLLDAC